MMEYFQLSTPLQKVERSWSMTIAFFIMNILVLGICALFIFPLWTNFYEVLIVGSLFVLANLFFIITMCHDPGFIEPHPDVDFLELLQLVEPTKLCPTCQIVKSPRSKHCNVTNRCVERMDHYCPWLNNCVGIRNHNYFIVMVYFLFTGVTTLLAFIIKNFIIQIMHGITQMTLYTCPFLPEKVVTHVISFYTCNIAMILFILTAFYLTGLLCKM